MPKDDATPSPVGTDREWLILLDRWAERAAEAQASQTDRLVDAFGEHMNANREAIGANRVSIEALGTTVVRGYVATVIVALVAIAALVSMAGNPFGLHLTPKGLSVGSELSAQVDGP